ncbi:hypothetical protein AB0N09_05620 [Streptomyces erythrochromogenes]|uniref:hypothetical protein n=1 Tax=Streptomyces erythrochromogenes TaxID=285574 RepID=UPI003422EB59
MPTKPSFHGRGHVPVAVYSCASDPVVRSGAEELGRRYAEARYWLVAAALSDVDPSRPLAERVGWTAILEALSSKDVHGVVVAGLRHAAGGHRVVHQLGSAVRGYGGFLAEAVGIRLLETDAGQPQGGIQ